MACFRGERSRTCHCVRKEYLEALQELLARIMKARGTLKRSLYRDRKRVADSFTAGGWPAELAAILANYMTKQQGAEQAVPVLTTRDDWSSVGFSDAWLIAPPPKQGEEEEDEKEEDAADDGLVFSLPPTKTASIANAMQEMKQDHKGGVRMAMLRGGEVRRSVGENMALPDDGQGGYGAKQWVMLIGRCAFRLGPNAWPLLGVSCTVQAVDHPALLVLVRIEQAHAHGLGSIDALKDFIQTATKEVLADIVIVVKLLVGGLLYIPPGTIAMPTTAEDQVSLVISHVWHAPETLHLTPQGRRLVCSHISGFLSLNSEKYPWKSLAPVIDYMAQWVVT